VHIDDKQIKVGKEKEYDLNAIDSKSKFILAHSVVATRSIYNVTLFMKQIKDWCYEQILQTYYGERKKKRKKRKYITFVYDGFENYHNTCKKMFYSVAKLVFGVPIACKKYGLKHNNNSIERYNREIDRRNFPKQNFLSHKGAKSFSLMRTIIHNFVNPHNQLKGLTPAKVAGIDLKLGRNKLLNLIKITARLR
jgi:transposase-like protein